jgi:predicted permease
MAAIFFQTLPFFAVIALGYGAARRGFFPPEATAYLTRFVFYFALPAMLFRFSASLSLAEIFDARLVGAYLTGTFAIYFLATLVARLRGRGFEERGFEERVIEAQCAVIGNVGFLGIPMLAMLLGEVAVGPVLQVLAVDLIVFSSLFTVLITGARGGRVGVAVLGVVGRGLLGNPMVMSISAGLLWSLTGIELARPADDFLTLLGAAATPGALFAIGASLADKSAERLTTASWLSFAKLALHPAAVAVAALMFFEVDPVAAGVMIAAAAMPVAGNVYILAQHYNVAPQRVSAAILISTIFAMITLPAVISWIG